MQLLELETNMDVDVAPFSRFRDSGAGMWKGVVKKP